MPSTRRIFIELPGGRFKRMSGKLGGNKSGRLTLYDEWDGKLPTPEKSNVLTVGIVHEPDLLGFEHIPPARLNAASYNGNGHVIVRTEQGAKYKLPIRQQAA